MILLDTHAFLWFEEDDARLTDQVRGEIETNPDVFVSIASFWEMSIKNSLKKLELNASITELMDDCAEFGFSILPIKASHLELLKDLPQIHKDPFDRLLVCQAQAENLTIATADENISKYEVGIIWR